jgi:hypothetical protein
MYSKIHRMVPHQRGFHHEAPAAGVTLRAAAAVLAVDKTAAALVVASKVGERLVAVEHGLEWAFRARLLSAREMNCYHQMSRKAFGPPAYKHQ